MNSEDVFVNQLNLDCFNFHSAQISNINIPLIVKETKECYCTYSKHTLADKNLWFKNLLVALKLTQKYLKLLSQAKSSKFLCSMHVGYR